MRQPRLFEFRMGERAPETHVVARANEDAVRLIKDWRAWPSGALALIGPAGSGKTHLALAWALEAGARRIAPGAHADDAAAVFSAAQGRVLVDDADQNADEAMLWRLLDLARAQSGAVLLTGAADPVHWPSTIPDLCSRLQNLAIARLGEPDEALMEVVLRRVCREQFILLSDSAARYLARRLPRTFAAARDWAATLDADLAKAAKPVTLSVARKALEKAKAQWRAAGDG